MENFFAYLAEGFDLPVLHWLRQTLQCDFLDKLMPVLTRLADAGIFWICLAAVLLLLPRHRKTGLGMGFALLLGLVVCNLLMKPAFARIRPYDYLLQQHGQQLSLLIPAQHDFSFPSGHTLASFEAATVLVLRNKKMGIPALVLACLIAFSRLYLYVHYPTDVLFSVAMGIGFGFLGKWLAHRFFPRLP